MIKELEGQWKEATKSGKELFECLVGTFKAMLHKVLSVREKMSNLTLKCVINNNSAKLFVALGFAGFLGLQACKSNSNKYEDCFGDDEKVFVVDVSANNNYNEREFTKRNEGKWNEGKGNNPDVRGISAVYVRVLCEKRADKKFQEFYNNIVELNKTAKPGQKIAIGGYAYFDKSIEGITDKGIERQVNAVIESLKFINKDNDGVVDLIPMLDFEYSQKEQKKRSEEHPGEMYPSVESEEGKRNKEAVLKRLELFEEKTGIIPGIYTGGFIYHDYFLNDRRFKKYPVWIAIYNENRVDQSPDGHSVKIGKSNSNSVSFQPSLVQFTDKIRGSGIGDGNDCLDGSSTTKEEFKKLIWYTSDAPTDIKQKNTLDRMWDKIEIKGRRKIQGFTLGVSKDIGKVGGDNKKTKGNRYIERKNRNNRRNKTSRKIIV